MVHEPSRFREARAVRRHTFPDTVLSMTDEVQPPILMRALVVIDGESEDVLDIHELQGFDLDSFLEQFDVPVETDPEMLDQYAVGPDDADFVNDHLEVSMVFDFRRNAYFIDALDRS